MPEVREKAAIDEDQIGELISLATKELRQVYRRAAVATSNGTKPDDTPASLVAVEREVVVGVIEYTLGPDSLYIRGLAVHPQHRRCGYANTLVRAAAGIAVREGKSKVTLRTIKETGNSDIFTRLGFGVVAETLAKEFEGSNGQPVTIVEMSRFISA